MQLRMAERALMAPVLHTHPPAGTAAVRRALALRLQMLHSVRQVSSFTQQRLLGRLLPACLQVSIPCLGHLTMNPWPFDFCIAGHVDGQTCMTGLHWNFLQMPEPLLMCMRHRT